MSQSGLRREAPPISNKQQYRCKLCRCGSSSHLRMTSKDCPLNRSNKVDEVVDDSDNSSSGDSREEIIESSGNKSEI